MSKKNSRWTAKRLRRALGFLGALLWLSGELYAAPDTAPVDFDIPSQPMAAALNSLAIQANRQIFFEDSVVTGLTGPAVAGRMSVDDALHELLANSALEFSQEDDGVIVLRKAPPTAAQRPKPRVHASQAIPIDSSTVTAPKQPSVPVVPEEGKWMVGLRAAYLAPGNGSDGFSTTAPAIDVARNGVGTSDRLLAEVDLEYFFSGHWSSELALLTPRGYDLSVHDSAPGTGTGRAGSFTQLPTYLTLKYNFMPGTDWRPYIGIGANVTSFYHVSATPYSLTSTSVGPAAQAGFDVKLGHGWFLNADIKWAWVHADLRYQGVDVSTVRIDPVVYGVGVAYRFGAVTNSQSSMPR